MDGIEKGTLSGGSIQYVYTCTYVELSSDQFRASVFMSKIEPRLICSECM